ncbi:MAG: 2'-5' RNA ligase family protein [Janthinobacterium lividum]
MDKRMSGALRGAPALGFFASKTTATYTDMDLPAHYEAMRAIAQRQLVQGQADLDRLLDSPLDDRRGITLLTRPPAAITDVIARIIADFQIDEPAQYYYPTSDIHLTILSIISCYRGFTLDLISPQAYREGVGAILQRTRPFAIRFAGFTASPGGIMVQGFPEDDGLQTLRDELRQFFQGTGLQQSIDQRYRIQTAHSTVIRFRSPLRDPGAALAKLARYQHYAIGTFMVDSLELVYNDWYQRMENTTLLERYSLRPTP